MSFYFCRCVIAVLIRVRVHNGSRNVQCRRNWLWLGFSSLLGMLGLPDQSSRRIHPLDRHRLQVRLPSWSFFVVAHVGRRLAAHQEAVSIQRGQSDRHVGEVRGALWTRTLSPSVSHIDCYLCFLIMLVLVRQRGLLLHFEFFRTPLTNFQVIFQATIWVHRLTGAWLWLIIWWRPSRYRTNRMFERLQET